MKQKVSKVASLAKNLSIMLTVVAFAACSLFKNEQNIKNQGVSLAPPINESTSMILYYPKLDGTEVLKVEVQVEDTRKNIDQWFSQMIIQLAQVKSSEVMPVFPEKIEFYTLFLDKDILYLDFSTSIQKAVYPSILIEHLALQAFLMSIKANFPFVNSVKILAEHEDAQVVFGHTYAQQPFSLQF